MVELVLAHLDIGYYMISRKEDDISLRKVNDPQPEKNNLPRGVTLIIVGDKPVFVRRVMGRFTQVSDAEQKELTDKYII